MAIGQNGCALRWAAEDLRADRDLVLAAVRQNGRALQYASNNLQVDKEVCMEAYTELGYDPEKLPVGLRATAEKYMSETGL